VSSLNILFELFAVGNNSLVHSLCSGRPCSGRKPSKKLHYTKHKVGTSEGNSEWSGYT